MSRFNNLGRIVLIMALAASSSFYGCTKKPNQDEVTKLEEARSAAESAERKLSDLRQERMDLEQELQGKQSELTAQESELGTLKSAK